MRCFMLRDGRVAMVAVLPQQNIPDEDNRGCRAAFGAAAAAGRLDGFEIWDLERKVYESAEVPRGPDK